MEFLGARFTSWFTPQQQLADAFMIRTTKLEPEKAAERQTGTAGAARRGSPLPAAATFSSIDTRSQ